ncbi:hypothetical protein EYF80_054457 [Liparis tanakae]|uniref:Uncharacterized protein n=1 Tax=Liparis tanakae TaxID=230148 RepID=A0A4Z2F3B6_9TELE|nr:hypothetical protein EYF80_054457 [Liparis tanakae]
MALCMATRPLPSLDWPSLLSRAYMFFSEKLQPWKSKWAEFTAISLGYSMFSTCREETENKELTVCGMDRSSPCGGATVTGATASEELEPSRSAFPVSGADQAFSSVDPWTSGRAGLASFFALRWFKLTSREVKGGGLRARGVCSVCVPCGALECVLCSRLCVWW